MFTSRMAVLKAGIAALALGPISPREEAASQRTRQSSCWSHFVKIDDGLADALSFGRAAVLTGGRAGSRSRLRARDCPTRHAIKGAELAGATEVLAAFGGGAESAVASMSACSAEAGAAAVPSIHGRGTRRDSGQGRRSDAARGRTFQGIAVENEGRGMGRGSEGSAAPDVPEGGLGFPSSLTACPPDARRK
jgi:hypothetical protein